MTSFALKFVLVWGWKRLLTAMCFGLLSAAALPPLSIWPVLFISMPILVWLLDGVHAQSGGSGRLWQAFWTGWSFAFGYFVVSLYWIGEAFLIEAEIFAWAIPLAVTLLPAGLALFWGCGCALAMLTWRPGFVRIVGLASGLALFEWLRGTILTGFPWNTLGYVLDAIQPLAQLAGFFGVYGLTFLVILWAAAPAALADDGEHYSQRVSRLACLLVGAVSVAGGFAYGNWRLAGPALGFQDGVNLRIVQPNIAQKDKWHPSKREEIFARYLKLTGTEPGKQAVEPVTHVIWPESALPVLIAELDDIRKQIGNLMKSKPIFIIGAVTRAPDPADLADFKVHNSVVAVSSNGDVIAQYHKQRLVPFGEFLPFAKWLEPIGLRKLVTLPLGFSPGPGPQTIALPNTPPFAALVCYEAIFPGILLHRNNRPHWLVNVTNDAWFGHSIGPHQHFAHARMRAIEEGLPLVRAANTGISAIIDPYGRVLQRLKLDTFGMIDGRLPRPLPPTLFAKYGNYVFFFLLGVAFLTVYGHFSLGQKSQMAKISSRSTIG